MFLCLVLIKKNHPYNFWTKIGCVKTSQVCITVFTITHWVKLAQSVKPIFLTLTCLNVKDGGRCCSFTCWKELKECVNQSRVCKWSHLNSKYDDRHRAMPWFVPLYRWCLRKSKFGEAAWTDIFNSTQLTGSSGATKAEPAGFITNFLKRCCWTLTNLIKELIGP